MTTPEKFVCRSTYLNVGLAGQSADRPYCIARITEQLFDVHPHPSKASGHMALVPSNHRKWLSGVTILLITN